MKRLIILSSFALLAPCAFAWSGYNYSTGSFFDVESYDHQYRGEGPVEYFDYRDAQYKTGYLDLYPGGTGVLYDDDTGEQYDIEMD